MAPHSKCKNSKTVIECSTSLEGSSLILSVMKEAATSAPIAELKNAACSALLIFKTTQVIKDAYERLGYDSSRLIIAIWCSFKKAEDPGEWLSAGMRDILDDFSHTLENIYSFLNEHLSRSKVIRVLFRRADAVKINDFLDHLKYVTQKFELHTDMSLTRVPKKKKEKPQEEREFEQPAEHVEVEDEHWIFNELKKIQKEAKDRKAEIERLRVAVYELEETNRLRRAEEEEEAAQLKQELAAKVDNRQSNKRTRPSYVDDFMARRYQGFTPVGLRSGSPIFIPGMHSNPYVLASSSMGPHGYRVGIPGLVVNADVGNINTSTVSNVGNVRKFYRPCSQRRRAGN